jgi:hypothetical protein
MIQDVRDIPEAKWQEFPCGSRLGFTTGEFLSVSIKVHSCAEILQE